jgi:4-amino-4-deoxy-L-arabinose transferase-like glycosyltransferase
MYNLTGALILKPSDMFSAMQSRVVEYLRSEPERIGGVQNKVLYGIYALALTVSISTWFLAIRSPLWLDETVSYFIVKGKVSEILSRQGWPGVPAYFYFLWLWTRALGTQEITLRLLSVLAMLGAAYLLYRTAQELFDRDIALIAAIVFCLRFSIRFAAIDIRPYAFAALAINASLFTLVRLRRSNSYRMAALFGFLAASIVYFQFLFVVVLLPLVICLFAFCEGDRGIWWRQRGIALLVFALAFLPVVPGMRYLFHTSGIHVFEDPPLFAYLVRALAQKRMVYVLAVVFLVAAATRGVDWRRRPATWPTLLCASMALIPILILYEVSVHTSLHIFVPRYRIVAAPGTALCWAWLVSRMNSRALRLMFCVGIVTVSAYYTFSSPLARLHDYSWKYALELVERNAAPDNAPVLLCSDLPESDYMPLPVGAAVKDSALFAPLSYYPLSVPVVALPRGLNDQAKQIASRFVRQAAQHHQRFLAVGFMASWETLDWISDYSDPSYDMRELGTLDNVQVLEYTPNHANTRR